MSSIVFNMCDVLISILSFIIAYANISPYKFGLKDYFYMIFSILILCFLLVSVSLSFTSVPIYCIPIIFIYIKSRNIIKSIILNVFIYLVIIFNSSLIGIIFIKVFKFKIVAYTTKYYFVSFVIYISLFVISMFLGKLIQRNKSKLIVEQTTRYGTLMTLTLLITFFIFYININWNTSKDPNYLTSINSFMFIMYFFILMFICCTLLFFINKDIKLKAKQIEFENLQEYTSNLESLYMDMRKFRHDYINILSSISAFLDEKDINGLEEYFYNHIYPLDSIMEKNNFKLELLKNIRNMELKGLLSAKLIRAQELNLNISIDILDIIMDIKMDIVDLIRALGIILDNAIESALESEEKRVELGIIKKESLIIIIVLNSYGANIPPIYQLLKEGFSTKGENRGLGLSNLKSIINNYNNIILDTSIEDKSFIQCLTISNKINT